MSETTITGLRLVRVSNDYPDNYRPASLRGVDLSGDAGLFYVRDSVRGGTMDAGPEYVVLVTREDDDRHRGMWQDTETTVATDTQHYGWNVERRYVTDVEPSSIREAAESEQREPGLDVPPHVFSQADVDAAREDGKREGRREAEREFERWKTQATEIAHQYANDNSLCSEFDRCMEEIGLPAREREYCVTLTTTTHVTVTATSEDDAADIASEYVDPDYLDWSVEYVERN